jgi:flagellar basal body-associated protein FliL
MTVEFSKRSIIIFIIVLIAATALTVEGVYFALKTFVLENPDDPITKAGGSTPEQKDHLGKAKGK